MDKDTTSAGRPGGRTGSKGQAPGGLGGLVLGAIGVVYGDLGTSPLYTVSTCFGKDGVPVNSANVLGMLSVIFWSLMLVVTVKYVLLVMRADNHGEGGILALLALARRTAEGRPRRLAALMMVGLAGAALFYGDGMITPAISVLSAVEGLEVATTAFKPFILPITIVVLAGLFVVQRFGTQGIGNLFGPVMTVWFLGIAALGLTQIVQNPQVLLAFDPTYAVGFFASHGWRGFVSLGGVVLALTGAEALYADMGHFGKRSIRLAWIGLVLPALALNYFGQGALLLREPEAAANPFFHMAPDWALYPLVALATAATVIASQAIISGAFSMTHQAIQLGFAPRMPIRHTSVSAIGQIYIPRVNWGLLVAVVALVVGFKSSANLAAAYGIAVTGTMATTTVLVYFVMRHIWRWRLSVSLVVLVALLVMDLSFFGANLLKIADGGWFPLAIGAAMFMMMATWKRGREVLLETLARPGDSLDDFVAELDHRDYHRVRGTAVFLTGSRHGMPYALRYNLRHNDVLHERVLVLTVLTDDVPYVPPDHRIVVRSLDHGFFRMHCRYGFMEEPDIPEMMAELGERGVDFDPECTSFFISRETLIPGEHSAMSPWRLRLFMLMARNAGSSSEFFKLPADQVIELRTQVVV
jgi:KUP system potassium uptake protein